MSEKGLHFHGSATFNEALVASRIGHRGGDLDVVSRGRITLQGGDEKRAANDTGRSRKVAIKMGKPKV